MAASDLQTGFYFSVSITGDTASVDAAFQEVSGLSKELGIEEVTSGGENRFKFRLPARGTYSNLVLKRGVVVEDSPLILWCKSTLDEGLANPIQTRNISVCLLNEKRQSTMQWNFIKAYPIKWAMSDLKSQESAILIETIEFAYQYFQADDARGSEESEVGSIFD